MVMTPEDGKYSYHSKGKKGVHLSNYFHCRHGKYTAVIFNVSISCYISIFRDHDTRLQLFLGYIHAAKCKVQWVSGDTDVINHELGVANC